MNAHRSMFHQAGGEVVYAERRRNLSDSLQTNIQCTCGLAAAVLDLSLPVTSVSLAVLKICSASSVT